MSRNVKVYEVGGTIKFTWVSSGAVASPIISKISDGAETVVNTATVQSSGNGHYFALHPAPNTPGFYVNGWLATISANTYANGQIFKVKRTEVD